MAIVKVVGVGPGPTSCLTKAAEEELLRANKVFFRTGAHPVCEWLRSLGKNVLSFDLLYKTPWNQPGDIYDFIVSVLLKEATLRGEAVYAVPGSPHVLEDTTRLLQLRALNEGVEVTVFSGVSFLEQILSETKHDFSLGLQIVLPLTHLQRGFFTTDLALVVCQIEAVSLAHAKPRLDLTMDFLLAVFPPDHFVTLIWTDGLPDYKTQSKVIALKDIVHEYGEGKFFASLYVPPLR